MTTKDTNTQNHSPAAEPLDLRLSEGLGAASEARGCDNCGKRGPWQTEHGISKNRAMTHELAECHHYPKPPGWRTAAPLWVSHGCGSGCQVWAPMERLTSFCA